MNNDDESSREGPATDEEEEGDARMQQQEEDREEDEVESRQDSDDASDEEQLDDETEGESSGKEGIKDDEGSLSDVSREDEEEEEEEETEEEKEEEDKDAEDSKPSSRIAGDGRELSEYELLRLERIQRNRQYLAQLGLEGKNGAGVLGQKIDSRPKKAKKKEPPPSASKRRSSLRAKKTIDYSEPSVSVASLLKSAAASDANKKPKPPKPRKERNTKDRSQRMEKFIYLEFKALQKHKNQTLRQAERDVRGAEKEVKFWSKRVEIAERREKRQAQAEAIENNVVSTHRSLRAQQEDERALLGGQTTKELLQEVDSRMPELMAAAERYDDEFEAEARSRQREERRWEAENKMKTLDALERFPKAMKDSVSLLNAVLLERAPKDPAPPRRSQRGVDESTPKSKPQKRKPAVSRAESGPTDNDNEWRSMPQTVEVSQDANGSPEKDSSGRGRKRNLRNVGGWISPNLAEKLDRSWLERDSPPEDFNPSFFIPQVGEMVLYYPSGHKEYLKVYPDVLGKKTRSLMRIPLWERADALQNEQELASGDPDLGPASPRKKWWTENWLEKVENDSAGYPLLCRVERTYAEFPPDPYKKIVKKGNSDADAVEILWKAPTDPSVLMKVAGTPLRLAVILRPMTPVMPPEVSSCPDDTSLPLPPTFCVVTFPSELKPFVIPFSWAYSLTHSISLGQNVSLRSHPGSRMRVSELASLLDGTDDCRFNGKTREIESLVSHFRSANSKNSFLEESLSKAPKGFPLRDGRAVLDTLCHFLDSNDRVRASETSTDFSDLFDLISRTLPIWNSVAIMRNVYDRKKTWVSPWELIPSGEFGAKSTYTYRLSSALSVLDEGLRAKIDCVIEDFASEHTSAGLFYYPVTDEDAPSYGCAVPVGMCFEKILRRLRAGRTSSKQCYYRGVEAVLADIGSILDNCLLYNSPESSVVDSAVEVVSKLKDAVARISQAHFHEMQEARRADEERRLLVMRSIDGEADDEDISTPRPPVVNTIRNPYKELLDHDWLQQIGKLEGTTPTAGERFMWIPQAGDRVLYSRTHHSKFVEAHYRSLEKGQCLLPRLPGSSDATGALRMRECGDANEEAATQHTMWIAGTVVWTRATFPKAFSKKSGEDANTFPTSSTLLAIGVQFVSSNQEVSVFYWRPCRLQCDQVPDESLCSSCGLSFEESFLRPEIVLNEVAGRHDHSSPLHPFSASDTSSIKRCLGLLERRCMRGEPVGYIDPNLTKANVRKGYSGHITRFAAKALPSFESLFVDASSRPPSTIGTRGISTRGDVDSSINSLVESGFLPPWASSTGSERLDEIIRQQAISPWPKLSLELVLIRLNNGYYRHRAAVESDVIEAYVSCCILLLSDAARRRKSPVSMKRVARMLASNRGRAANVDSGTSEPKNALVEEEASWVARLSKIRELHAMALVSVTDTSHTERMLGLVSRQIPRQLVQVSTQPEQDPVRSAARQKLKYLLSAVGKDQLLNTFGSAAAHETAVPPMKIKIVCDGAPVSNVKYFSTLAHATAAKQDDSLMKVRIKCNGRVVTGEKQLYDEEPPPLEGVQSAASPTQFHSLRVKVLCGDKQVSSGAKHPAIASVPSPLGDPNLTRIVENSISLKTGDDYEGSETLVRFLFGRPGRMNPCGRCKAYRRSLFACRVRRAHSNVDYDWISSFSGVGGVDSLLQMLHPKESAETVHQDGTSAVVENRGDANLPSDGIPEEETAPTEGTRPESAAPTEQESKQDADDDERLDESTRGDDEQLVDPRVVNAKAKTTLSLAKRVLQEAKEYANAPARFSKSFVDAAFPIDESDGHYVYCVVCGLSGNLLCCDGCSNVVHTDCVSLNVLPEGDWFCDECTMKASGSSGGPGVSEEVKNEYESTGSSKNQPDEVEEKKESEGAPAVCSSVQRSPFGRVEFDEEKAQQVSVLLEELNASRPARFQKKARLEEDAREEDVKAADMTEEGRGRPRKRRLSDDEDVPADGMNKAQRRRDRPRKVVLIEEDESGDETIGSIGRSRRENSRRGRSRQRPLSYNEDTSESDKGTPNSRRRRRSSRPSNESSGSPQRTARRNTSCRLLHPFEALSAVAQKFLDSVGITNAEAFLSTRTCDIAEELIKWRMKEGMPELRGTGSIATVSAWKTSCRKAAKEMGLEDVAHMEPDNISSSKMGHKNENVGKRRGRQKDRSRSPSPQVDGSAHEDSEVLSVESGHNIFSSRNRDHDLSRGSSPRSRRRNASPPKRFGFQEFGVSEASGRGSSRSPHRGIRKTISVADAGKTGVSESNDASSFSALAQAKELLLEDEKPSPRKRRKRTR